MGTLREDKPEFCEGDLEENGIHAGHKAISSEVGEEMLEILTGTPRRLFVLFDLLTQWTLTESHSISVNALPFLCLYLTA